MKNHMVFRSSLLSAVATIALLAITQTHTFAQGWTGEQPGTLSNLVGLTRNGDTFTWLRGSGSTSGTLSVQGKFQNASLLAIRGFWIVDANGNTLPGFGTSSTGGYVTNTSNVKSFWDTDTSPYGYVSSDNGFGANKDWLALVSNSTLQSYGATTSNSASGSFTIQGLSNWLNTTPGNYSIGLDYMVGTGGTTKTGRVFFAAPSSLKPAVGVPESGSGILIGVAVAGLASVALLARRRSATNA